MLRRLLTLLTVLTLACASAQAYVPERSLLHAGELASPAKTAPRGFAAQAESAAKEKSRTSDCCIRENWHPPLKLASSMQFTGHYREREGNSYYAQQRYYRPGLGRFNRIDPWEGDEANPITLNKYLYANGNPLAFIDPDGRAAHPCVGTEEGCPRSGLSAAQYAAFVDGRIADMGMRDAITTLRPSAEDLITQTQPQIPEGPTMSAPWEGRLTGLQATAHVERLRRAEGRANERRIGNALSLLVPWSNHSGGVLRRQKVNVFDGEPMTASEREDALLDLVSFAAPWQPASRLSTLAAPRVVRSGAAAVEQRAVQQTRPVTVVEGSSIQPVAQRVDAQSIPDTKAIVQSLTDRAVAELRENPQLAKGLMSAGSYRHLERGTPLAAASFGKAVERLVARYVQENESLAAILQHTGLTRAANGQFVPSPDFIGKEAYNLRLIDITTPSELEKHLARPRGQSTEHVLYEGLPPDLDFD